MADFAKKLTVSFGAFSCTLSGFDDPFPVMSQVVDYFQKLSKSDPSFGAHPERPDTEALRVLAEKTSGLAVGAEMNGDEVVLSSVADDIQDEFSAPQTVEPQTQAPVIAEEIAPTPLQTEVAQETQVSPAIDTSVLEQPAEDIEAVVSKAMEEAKTVTEAEPITVAAAEPTDVSDTFAKLELDDLKDEVFENIDAADIYDAVQPVELEEPKTAIQEDVSGYIKEAVAFTDMENLDDADLLVETPEENALHIEPPSADPVPIWEAELVSDEPIEIVEKIEPSPLDQLEVTPKLEEDTISYDDHVAAEQTALARILAASGETNGQATDKPVSELHEQPKVEAEQASVEIEEEPVVVENAAETARSLILGFGAAASLDATHDVVTSAVDNRTVDPSAQALAAMGMYEEESDDFGWVSEAETAKDEVEETPAVAPLLLTPMQKVPPVEEKLEVEEIQRPSSSIDMTQEDPRADLRHFADAAGAVSLTELLEASAAFSTLVNGRPSFSRGEVLDLLDEFSEDDGFSQEARIKTFGSLLRGGRIQRVENGKYEMTHDALSHYQSARKAG